MAANGGPFDLGGKVAIVTGGASGIGFGVARALAEAGALVVIADVALPQAEDKAARLVAEGLKAAALPVDMASEESIVGLCARVVEAYGAPWVLVNNAGVQDRELLLEATAAEWARTEAINGRGPFLLTREVARAMVAAGVGGRIVNISSACLTGQIVTGLTSYAASKGAVLGLSRASALELAEHGVTVNVIMPGGIPTEGARVAKGPPTAGPGCREGAFGRGLPEDVGAAVLFFASPAAHRITNQVLKVDAGFSIA